MSHINEALSENNGVIPTVGYLQPKKKWKSSTANGRDGHKQRHCCFSSGSGSATVFFYQQRKAAAPLFLRRSSDQRSSASVKIIDLPLLQKKDFEDSVLCSHLIIKSQLKCRLAQLDINTMKQINENLKPSDGVRSQAMFHIFITTIFIVFIARD